MPDPSHPIPFTAMNPQSSGYRDVTERIAPEVNRIEICLCILQIEDRKQLLTN